MNNYNYSVIYKDVADITIKVKPSLDVEIIVPYNTSSQYIDKILSKRRKWIQNHIDIFEKLKQIARQYISGEDFIYLGRRYRLKVISSDLNIAILKNGVMNLHCINKDDFGLKQKLIEDFYHQKAISTFNQIIAKYKHLYTQKVIFRIRKMKTRWGSCNPVKGYINLNQELIKKPKKAIEYVVLHEIAHLKHHNHDRKFYNYLSAYMPDWKDVKHKLDYIN